MGRARHIVVAANGDMFVKLDKLKDGKGIYRLHDSNGDGKADKNRFWKLYRYRYHNKEWLSICFYPIQQYIVIKWMRRLVKLMKHQNKKLLLVCGIKHQHEAKSITLDNEGNIYVNIGAPSNCCQVQDRTKGSPGKDPCPILDSAGGIWQFKADKLNQSYAEGVRYATGLRNVVGLDWNT